MRAAGGEVFVFGEPAFVTGLPLFSHSLAGSLKDVVASRLQARLDMSPFRPGLSCSPRRFQAPTGARLCRRHVQGLGQLYPSIRHLLREHQELPPCELCRDFAGQVAGLLPRFGPWRLIAFVPL